MFALPPQKVPPLKTALEVPTVSAKAPCVKVPEYPAFIWSPATEGAISKVQLPLLAAAPSKIAISAAPGTDAPPAPPDVVDQLAVLFQFEFVVLIQNLFAENKLKPIKK